MMPYWENIHGTTSAQNPTTVMTFQLESRESGSTVTPGPTEGDEEFEVKSAKSERLMSEAITTSMCEARGMQ
jgi:hypothetical protein